MPPTLVRNTVSSWMQLSQRISLVSLCDRPTFFFCDNSNHLTSSQVLHNTSIYTYSTCMYKHTATCTYSCTYIRNGGIYTCETSANALRSMYKITYTSQHEKVEQYKCVPSLHTLVCSRLLVQITICKIMYRRSNK